jgi:hypothetical protein
MTLAATPVSTTAEEQHEDYDNQDHFHGKTPLTVTALFAAHRILHSADCVLNLARNLVGLAVSFQLLVAEDLPGGFFHGTIGPLCGTFDPIFIRCRILACGLSTESTLAATF